MLNELPQEELGKLISQEAICHGPIDLVVLLAPWRFLRSSRTALVLRVVFARLFAFRTEIEPLNKDTELFRIVFTEFKGVCLRLDESGGTVGCAEISRVVLQKVAVDYVDDFVLSATYNNFDSLWLTTSRLVHAISSLGYTASEYGRKACLAVFKAFCRGVRLEPLAVSSSRASNGV